MSDSGHNAVSSNMQDDAVINTVILRTLHSGMVRQWRSARLQNFINAQWIGVAHSWKTTRANSVQWKMEVGNRLRVGAGVQVDKAPWRAARKPTNAPPPSQPRCRCAGIMIKLCRLGRALSASTPSGCILTSRWLGSSAFQCGRGPCSLFTAQSWLQASQPSACSPANIPTTVRAAAAGVLSATGKEEMVRALTLPSEGHLTDRHNATVQHQHLGGFGMAVISLTLPSANTAPA